MKKKELYQFPSIEIVPVETENCIAVSDSLNDLDKNAIYEEDF